MSILETGKIKWQPSDLLHGWDLTTEDTMHENQPFERNNPAFGLLHTLGQGPHKRFQARRRRSDPCKDSLSVSVIDVQLIVACGLDDCGFEIRVTV